LASADPNSQVGSAALTSSAPMNLPVLERPGRIEAAANGDRAAAHALALELMPRVRNLVRYLTRRSDVDDVTQEALVTVLRSLPGYRPTGSFNAWVDRVVVHKTYAELRRERRRARHESLDEEREVAGPSDFATTYATRTRIAAALDALPVEQRFAVVLYHVLGMSAVEVAEEMGAPFETTRSRLRLGMQHLRRSLQATTEKDPR
jgi:RNA polymerase sigma-70 factor, ECF subfamily